MDKKLPLSRQEVEAWGFFRVEHEGRFPIFEEVPEGYRLAGFNEPFTHYARVRGRAEAYWIRKLIKED